MDQHPTLELGQRWSEPSGVEVTISDSFQRDGRTNHIGAFTAHPRHLGRRGVTTVDTLLRRGFSLLPQMR